MKALQTLLPAGLGLALCLGETSCTTTYDTQGRPVQSVTPEAAALGIVAAGLVGYALADDDDHRHKNRKHDKRRHCHRNYHDCGRYYDRGRHCRY